MNDKNIAKKKHLRLTRERADVLLKELVERAKKINEEEVDFVLGISRLAVFGSYMTDKQVLGDLDIAVELGRRDSDPTKYAQRVLERGRAAKGNFASSLGGRILWVQEEVHRALKARVRAISIHGYDEFEHYVTEGLATGKELFRDDRFAPEGTPFEDNNDKIKQMPKKASQALMRQAKSTGKEIINEDDKIMF
jgi:predicted nucleotidyltransferase